MTTILVIEDMESLREEIEETLNCEGFTVLSAENGNAGIKLARERFPDLIVCDVMMPELDGYGTLQVLRSDPATATIPFIFLTARADRVELRHGMESGADDYLTKPFATTELLAAIAARLQKKKAVDRLVNSELETLRRNITLSLPHELRTPLNGILGFSELLVETLDAHTQSDLLEMAENIHTSAKSLFRIIQNFLLYAELEIAASHPKPMSKSGVATNVAEILIAVCFKKARQYERVADLKMGETTAAIAVPAAQFYKVVEELIDNCFKYSAAGSPVMVACTERDRRVWVEFSDRGRGMTEDQLQHVGAYMQFERKLHEQQGTGLGLTIARRIIELHEGTLEIQSRPHEFTTVLVALPAFEVA